MSIPRSLDGFDVGAAVERMLDQPSLWWEALGLFVEHFSGWERDWHASVGDDINERKKVHALRSAAANIGAGRLSSSASALEKCLLDRLAGDVSGDVDALRQAVQDDFRHAWQVAADARRGSLLVSGERA